MQHYEIDEYVDGEFDGTQPSLNGVFSFRELSNGTNNISFLINTEGLTMSSEGLDAEQRRQIKNRVAELSRWQKPGSFTHLIVSLRESICEQALLMARAKAYDD